MASFLGVFHLHISCGASFGNGRLNPLLINRGNIDSLNDVKEEFLNFSV